MNPVCFCLLAALVACLAPGALGGGVMDMTLPSQVGLRFVF